MNDAIRFTEQEMQELAKMLRRSGLRPTASVTKARQFTEAYTFLSIKDVKVGDTVKVILVAVTIGDEDAPLKADEIAFDFRDIATKKAADNIELGVSWYRGKIHNQAFEYELILIR